MRNCWFVSSVMFSLGTLLLATPGARAEVDTDGIEKAANRAVEYLKGHHAGGFWRFRDGGGENDIGTTALVGLALLESDVSPKDPLLQAAARTVQNAGPALKTTYAISSAILFLDRYGDGRENALVRTLTVRLAAGQSQADGGWTYSCPILSGPAEQGWLRDLKAPKFKNTRDFGTYAPGPAQTSDNSNSQFAVLALWVGRNHGVAVDYPLFKAEWRFRATQSSDGGWNYTAAIAGANVPNTPSMTCAGLLGLAVAYGAKREQQMAKLRADEKDGAANAPAKPTGVPRLDIANDPAVLKAKQYLTEALQRPPNQTPHYLYFLWSLERVSVTYKFKEYGKIDWYEYGSNLLIKAQKPDGSWELEDGSNIDTAFALLFLRRANLIGDISGVGRWTAEKNIADPTKPASGGNTAAKPKAGQPQLKELPKGKDAAEEAKKYVAEFPTAKPARQDEILENLQDTRDRTGSFTQALLDLIPLVKDNLQVRVRAALADRLSRQPLSDLKERLTEMDIELRIAVARALGMKTVPGTDRPDMRAMPDLIKLLGHSNEDLAAAAEQSLAALTDGKEFGRNAARWQEYYDSLPPARR